MVQLSQIEDDSVQHPKTEVPESNFEDVTESESEDEDDDDFENETFYDRIVALKDIIPVSQRSTFSSLVSSVKNFALGSTFSIGNLLWVVSSSTLLLATPVALSILSEQQLIEMENEFKSQQEANDILAPGSESAFESSKSSA